MKKTAFILALSITPVIAIPGDGHKDTKTEKTMTESISDTQIYSTLWAKYAIDDDLNPLDMDIEVENGVVSLHGTVDTLAEQKLAGEIAEGTNGIHQIHNHLKVNHDGTQSTRDLSDKASELARDASIETRLAFNRHVMGNDVDVTVENNTATLVGTVESRKAYAVAESIAKDTEGINTVVNNIEIVENKEDSYSEMVYAEMVRLSNMAEDSWVETKVETELILSQAIETDEMDIEVVDGLVILTGSVPTDAQRDLAEELAADIVGVKDIENRLDLS